jgi:hypothetical protein
MASVYHTFNRYLPAIGRVLQVLQSYGPAGTTIQACNRDLARAADLRSAGGIPAILRTLEADGQIERVTSPQGSLIVVLGDDESTFDRTLPSDQGIVDRSMPDSASQRSSMVDPPTPPNRYKQHDQQQHGALSQKNDWSEITISGAQWVPTQALERAGHTPESVRQADAKMRTRHEYTREEQIKILFQSLLHQQPIYSAADIAARTEEHDHATAAAPTGRDGAGARRSSRTHSARRSASDPEPNEERDREFAAMRAEFERIAAERARVQRL